jgi:transcriptional antiterminator RfaH
MTWYCAYTSVRHEYRASTALREQGFTVYVPSETHWVRHARKKSKADRPIFPRYIFVETDGAFYDIRNTDGVESILGFCGEPQPIPFEWIAEMQVSEQSGAFDYTRDNTPTFEKNDPVRIIGGPFAGQLATIMKAKPGKARAKVLLRALGGLRPRRVDVKVTELERAA